MFKSFLEQRLNFIFTHLEEYQTSLRPFQQEAASECKISDNLTIERREDYWTVSDLQSALFGSSDSSILEQRLNFIFTHSEEYQMSLRPFQQETASAKNGSTPIERMEDYWICTVQFGSSDSLGGLFYYFDGNLEHKSSVYKNFMLSFPKSQ